MLLNGCELKYDSIEESVPKAPCGNRTCGTGPPVGNRSQSEEIDRDKLAVTRDKTSHTETTTGAYGPSLSASYTVCWHDGAPLGNASVR
jgi:hypothetical protein